GVIPSGQQSQASLLPHSPHFFFLSHFSPCLPPPLSYPCCIPLLVLSLPPLLSAPLSPSVSVSFHSYSSLSLCSKPNSSVQRPDTCSSLFQIGLIRSLCATCYSHTH